MSIEAAVLKLAEAHEGIITEHVLIVFTAFLFRSPQPGVKWTREVIYGWCRGSLFTIFNRNHPETPDPKGQEK